MKKPKRTYNNYEDELRQFNDAAATRKGKKRNGFAPSFFAESFEYKQPRRNHRGCGDIRWILPVTGEVKQVHCDDVTKTFMHTRAPTGKQFALRVDRRDLADDK